MAQLQMPIVVALLLACAATCSHGALNSATVVNASDSYTPQFVFYYQHLLHAVQGIENGLAGQNPNLVRYSADLKSTTATLVLPLPSTVDCGYVFVDNIALQNGTLYVNLYAAQSKVALANVQWYAVDLDAFVVTQSVAFPNQNFTGTPQQAWTAYNDSLLYMATNVDVQYPTPRYSYFSSVALPSMQQTVANGGASNFTFAGNGLGVTELSALLVLGVENGGGLYLSLLDVPTLQERSATFLGYLTAQSGTLLADRVTFAGLFFDSILGGNLLLQYDLTQPLPATASGRAVNMTSTYALLVDEQYAFVAGDSSPDNLNQIAQLDLGAGKLLDTMRVPDGVQIRQMHALTPSYGVDSTLKQLAFPFSQYFRTPKCGSGTNSGIYVVNYS